MKGSLMDPVSRIDWNRSRSKQRLFEINLTFLIGR